MTRQSTANASPTDAPYALADGLYAGKVVLVTGGGSGIGAATVWLLARLGARVAFCGRTPERLAATEAALRDAGHDGFGMVADIRDEDAIAALFARIAAEFGTLDLVVNNAGGQFAQAMADFRPKGWRAVIETNLTGPWLVMQAAAQSWIAAQRGGAIVNLVAANARGMPGIAHSSAARAGVINLSRTAAVEWAEHGIRVNCVAPGLIATAGLDSYPDEARAHFVDANPQRRSGDPFEVAQAIAFLGSSAASYITGATLTIDGGGSLSGELWTHRAPPYGQDE
ncbi:SDR family NAD(P)-dependent oxidoreductase [Sphingopyxis sp.]|uniref:SDR family NAD(P)-dependent oxidoreductase n=1 Tax=Sphingopyxis sp. TaxID=1908224 RepID=UPI003D0C9571